jgi:DNA-binding HxlR family transcriptional regulator
MKKSDFSSMPCPVARALDHLGDGWTVLTLREAFYGAARFDDFKEALGVATNTLTRVLKDLVESGVFERLQYQDRPPRFEYVLTQKGRDLRPVLLTLLAWGNTHAPAPSGVVQLVDSTTGQPVDLQLIDRTTGKPIGPEHKINRKYPRERASKSFAFPDLTPSPQP